MEIAYIVEGYGTRYVGSHVESYKKGDLVLVGEELIHVWISHDSFYPEDTNLLTKAIVVKFHPNFAGNDFLNLPQAYPIVKILEEASGGLRIRGGTNKAIAQILENMLAQSELDQIISLIQILNLISKSEKTIILSPYDLHKSSNSKDKARMNQIIKHTMLYFKRNISLDEISDVANLSNSAFCRYFKSAVKKSYNEFLYEIRVQYACKLLLENEMGISEIGYESGFNNPSSFSKIFKKQRDYPSSIPFLWLNYKKYQNANYSFFALLPFLISDGFRPIFCLKIFEK